MSANLDREGIFKARPCSWRVKVFPSSQAVSIAIEFVILAQLDGDEWVDWTAYDEVRVWGDFFVVKKTGEPNVRTVQQLGESLGWGGSLKAVQQQPPPPVTVQTTVKAEDYNGKTYYKAAWINPEDYEPGPGGASEAEVGQLEARFGSLLRAAVGKPKPAPASKPAPVPPGEDTEDYGKIPF